MYECVFFRIFKYVFNYLFAFAKSSFHNHFSRCHRLLCCSSQLGVFFQSGWSVTGEHNFQPQCPSQHKERPPVQGVEVWIPESARHRCDYVYIIRDIKLVFWGKSLISETLISLSIEMGSIIIPVPTLWGFCRTW